ncbi:hypothetical protein ACHAXR_011854 [Thalassiosira sp. AJA248-18]
MAAVPTTMIKTILLWHLVATVDAFNGGTTIGCYTSSLSRCGRSQQHASCEKFYPAMASDPNNTENDGKRSSDDNKEEDNLDEKNNSFLDTPMFDPNDPSNDNNWFANLVKNDYESAESLYVGAIVIFGVIVAQELLRIVKYGGGYASSGGGNLF